MSDVPAATTLPRGVRRTAIFALVFTAVVGLFAASEAMSLGRPFEATQIEALRERVQNPKVLEEAFRAQEQALEGMRVPRAFTLGVLAALCSLAFFAASRLLRPLGFARESMRRLLARTALLAAVARTVDGAQMAALAGRVGEAMARAMSATAGLSPEQVEQLRGLMRPIALTVAVGQTLLVVGGFFLLWQYFRSARVKDALAALEKRGQATF